MMKIKLDLDLKETEGNNLPRIKAIFWEIGRRLALIDHFLGISPEEIMVRETRKGFHVYITTIEDFDTNPEMIVSIQLLLFSDWKREMFNLRRIIFDRKSMGEVREGWNVLFLRKKDHDGELSKEERTKLSDELANKIVEGYEDQMAYLVGEKT